MSTQAARTRRGAGRGTVALGAAASLAVIAALLLPGTAARASFPGVNGRIAFQTRTNEHVQTIDPDGSGRGELPVPLYGAQAKYSPDGSRLVYFGGGHVDDIWVANADGSGQQQLTTYPGLDWLPSWSPDGEKIVWSRDFDL